MAAALKTEPTFSWPPRVLFSGSYTAGMVLGLSDQTHWDIGPDGKRFRMMKESGAETEGSRRINIALNWTEELKMRVPTGKK